MSQQTRIVFNSDGFREILNSPGTQSLVQSTTDTIQAKANAGISGESSGFYARVEKGNYGGGRWVGFVGSTDHASLVAETENKALTKAVSG